MKGFVTITERGNNCTFEKIMLNHFVHPATISIGQPVEGVPSVQGYTPYNQLNKLLPAFDLPDKGGKSDDEDKKQHQITLHKEKNNEESDLPEIFKLAVNVSFKDLFKYFFTPNHDQILDVRRKIYSAVNEGEMTIFIPKGDIPIQFNIIRKHLYEIQMQLFQTSKGLHCHMILFKNN